MAKVFLSIGSNTGERLQHLQTALAGFEEIGKVVKASSVYETEPWGFQSPTAFLNQVVELETEQDAETLLQFFFRLETACGRKRAGKGYASRSLDIDILMYDDVILESPLLSIPHPRLHERMFVLQPFAEIAPLLMHPILQQPIVLLLEACEDDSWIELHQG